jgi:hypothetical protein
LKARPNATFEDFSLYVIRGPKRATVAERGLLMARCPHCEFITDGVRVIPEELKHPELADILQKFGTQKIEDIINRQSGG